ncbi:MAG: Aspartyl/glutamyl-tRNA(Asn/Gln) amidotransferase subunit C [Candidatus Woesebacteria bacterium GW2011_GWA1_33_30]|uniref:Aspartyl/glutamyl-tRNA(Asn/Gln) amidotransferase subunit C n=1 Tax=Candidatus Woesebacteria bacterium GW2011_GWA2_33_28 TaxID=1618561 RepID=A0A0G0C6Y1_9BACT|nr:MAG: Aspartyl/glutamyl-tRNA(Asn/Gln) amidotransferase subunit C [Candidatus Woesebacteria bacterium GW2011_GWA2_33_28]KKP47879.1 MAG: Aspartyl/glutamyl-tRNA(Asn/Gln) amidotransferase subunit C [Candidatus Woesebacteria bacterium GW2011_GWA1_33_30]KKP49322.1 MAG: aspartyl/glutamyl-tRNA(asn/Gln) amidotransferase subunit C, aspartyl-tRNA(Asn)/glutamyl-tRNA (Gln) amidotransferase subunit C [Microgenomates group bacterium GW2011_GWC1_33_32]KKP52032.1 MAG: Aspartyl/glutamyl-tRNA(Asn/Gln) amidotrans
MTDVKKIAKLAKIEILPKHLKKFSDEFDSIVKLVSKIQELNLKDIKGTSNSTNLKNVTREDAIDTNRILSQEDALKNAKRVHNGYFVVDAILE